MIGLGALAAAYLEKNLTKQKKLSLSNWEQPLNEAQQECKPPRPGIREKEKITTCCFCTDAANDASCAWEVYEKLEGMSLVGREGRA